MGELIIAERSDIVAVAHASRSKIGGATELTLGEMINGINSIVSSGGIDTFDATATAEDILSGETAYVNGVKIVGTHECEVGTDTSDATIVSGNQMLSGVTAYGANGKITGTIPSQGAKTIMPTELEQTAISSGIYASGDIKVAAIATETKELTSNGTHIPSAGKYFSSVTVNVPSEDFITQSKTVSPSTEQQVIMPDSGYHGLESVTVNAIPSEYITTTDADALAEDIASGKTAYVNGEKITGTHTCSSGGTDTSDATATAEDIISGQTAYVNGEKVTGTLVVNAYYAGDTEPDDSFGNDGDLYFVRGE